MAKLLYGENVKAWTVWFEVVINSKAVMHDIDVLAVDAECAVWKATDIFWSDQTPDLYQVVGFESAYAEEVVDDPFADAWGVSVEDLLWNDSEGVVSAA